MNLLKIQNRNSRQQLYLSAALACELLLLTIDAIGQSATGTLRGQVLVNITDPNFLNPKIFSGGNRQITLTAKHVF